ncbi:MAG: oxygen-independent coproporphyrinogen III oxidase-like protein, partial [Gammaproteobacteria bacterium]
DAQVAECDLAFEYMMNALRLIEGVPIGELRERTGLQASSFGAALEQARARGWIEENDKRLRTTATGQRFLNDVIGLFLPDSGTSHA